MGTPLYNTDVIPLTSRPTLTVMDDGDYFVILDTSTGKISKILRTDVQKALSISYNNTTSGLTATQVQAALDELVVNLGSSDNAISALAGRLDILEADDTTEGSVAKSIKDAVTPIEARLDTTELTLARQGQDLASVKQTLQQGNGATLDFSDIGIVPLDARATGRANPTIEGLTARQVFTSSSYQSSDVSAISGIKFVHDGNGKITVTVSSGGATANRTYRIATNYTFIATNKYFFDGCPSTSSYANKHYIQIGLTLGIYANARVEEVIDTPSNVNITIMSGCAEGTYIFIPMAINLTQTFGAGNEPTADQCKKIFSYFDGTKSIQLPARVRSVSEDESETSTLYIADNEEVRSFGATTDLVKVVNGEFVLEKNVNDDATAVISPPIITNLTTSGVLQAKPNGTVYFEPYYEGSHQTNASSQITLPYEGTIDKLTGYDENLEPYEVPSTAYTLVGTTLTITGALENEVFFVQMSRSEPLAPEMSVNVINNEQVTLDSADGKYYQIGFATTNGVPTVTATEVV